MIDEFDLNRFLEAQAADGIYDHALNELLAGHKVSHWMWFVFPQLAGLGQSYMSQHFAISGLDEARAYLAHPVLGPRLIECSAALLALAVSDAVDVLGPIDAQKLQSSMTLFTAAAPAEQVFGAVLEKFYSGRLDKATISRL